MIEYISTIGAFIALIVGVVGNTWDKKKRGIKKVTLTGWITLGIGFLALATSLYRNYQNHWEARQRANITSIAYFELFEAMHYLTLPLVVLHYNVCQKSNPNCSIEPLLRDADYMYSELASESFQKKLANFDFRNRPELPHPWSDRHFLWWTLFYKNAQEGEARFNEVWIKYAIFLDPETLSNIQELLKDPFFRFYLLNLKEDVEKHGDVRLSEMFRSSVVVGPMQLYPGYIRKLDALRRSIRHERKGNVMRFGIIRAFDPEFLAE